ncbi:MAG: hypothetical protein GX555_06245 [Actinomycetales bacterium]|nr:hypothetical protein [Actinomycetales bacterium]
MRRQGVWRAGALAVVLLGGLVGCGLGPGTVDEAMWSSVPCVTDGESPRTSGYELVPTDLLPYAREERTVVDLTAPEPTTDDDGVLQVTWKDHDGPVYHPVNTAAYGLSLLESYRVTGEQDYLDRAAANASALLAGAESDADGALWFPYRFDYELHQDRDLLMEAPWYSGMAQGQGLSLLVRLHEEMGEERWLAAADSVFASFGTDHAAGEPHFTLVDECGHLWFEEYVDDLVEPTHVVNGHIYAMFGLYDYAQAYGSPEAERLFDAAATTVAEQFPRYRLEGNISFYCAARYCHVSRWQPPHYHRGVAAQLDALHRMTGAAIFAEHAETFRADYEVSGEDG